MIIIRVLLAITLGLLITFPTIISSATLPDIYKREKICDISIGSLALYLATSYITSANTIHVVSPVALNDVLCETNENMANIALMARKENSDEFFYGIFHIHFDKDGRIISSVPIHDWITVREFKDPLVLNIWCDFIRSVYPTELKQQGCID